ncbi:hypothetical protein CON65_18500 [Bacillus pseudomycoides]|uniref:FAD:protein FMN transferase n=1 Tax=Bacillus pseudomycoides TaxID=64104 RepID=A0AA91VAT1_9BACI|nr:MULTISPECIES: FAD:protein FMN transferase [Bacillus]PEB50672.1 hypothetical protein COO03_21015 [Bacillus sp. AFS098217]PED81213.1 hypothetical protein CON65_18500 [Bacillus pseudomycoides]PEU16534.1 hypothetical protein CN524_04105 [Bacillus sp. AFS019443]PEU21454.1 hypothetical protein CN525_01920 [Bacillus sp. AFS014408]PFW61460.1 hypothetical protein COL20_17480 [Bacillus sp. AFS075034]
MDGEYSFSFRAMNTEVQVKGDAPWNSSWSRKLKECFFAFESICSRFLNFNELAMVNRAPIGAKIKVSPILFDVLKEAIRYAEMTDYYFNPLMARRMERMGYDRSFDQITDVGSTIDNDIGKGDCNSFQFDHHASAIVKQTSEKVDLGGIGKGWVVDRGARLMRQAGVVNGILNAGGDLTVWGNQEKVIGIADPEKEERDIAQFYFLQGCMATSNKKHRSWKQGSFVRHHLLDGQTGLQAESDVIQATVFAKSTAESEVIAKVLCILSFHEGILWMLEHFPHAAAVIIDENGKVKVSATIKRYTKKMMF